MAKEDYKEEMDEVFNRVLIEGFKSHSLHDIIIPVGLRFLMEGNKESFNQQRMLVEMHRPGDLDAFDKAIGFNTLEV